MKITVGVCNFSEIEYFLTNGADEVSFGLDILPSFCNDQNIHGAVLKDVLASTRFVHKIGKKIFVYANSICSDWAARISIMQYLYEVVGIDGFIIASEEQILSYPKTQKKPQWVMGILGFCFNNVAARWYRQHGVSRLILPQQLLCHESKEICLTMPETEFYYIIHEMDKNIDGLCLGCEVDKGINRFCSRGFNTPNGYVTFPALTLEERLSYFYHYSQMCSFVKIVRFGTARLRKFVFSEVIALRELALQSSSVEKFVKEALYVMSSEFVPKFNSMRRDVL